MMLTGGKYGKSAYQFRLAYLGLYPDLYELGSSKNCLPYYEFRGAAPVFYLATMYSVSNTERQTDNYTV